MRYYSRWQQKRIEKRIFIFNIVAPILILLSLIGGMLLWPPIILAGGLLIAAQGVLRLVAAARGWDAFCSFRVGDEKDSYSQRHWFAIISGLIYIAFGIVFVLLFREVIIL